MTRLIWQAYDAVVIDARAPSDFAPDMPQRILDAAASGAGLFIVNGPLRGSVEDMQRLSDWEDTVIGPVLPVNSNPAQYIAAPPKRDILIIVDTSGSMGEAPTGFDHHFTLFNGCIASVQINHIAARDCRGCAFIYQSPDRRRGHVDGSRLVGSKKFARQQLRIVHNWGWRL